MEHDGGNNLGGEEGTKPTIYYLIDWSKNAGDCHLYACQTLVTTTQLSIVDSNLAPTPPEGREPGIRFRQQGRRESRSIELQERGLGGAVPTC